MKGQLIVCIPADRMGNKLWLKDLRFKGDRVFVKYKSTYNGMGFMETEIYQTDGGHNFVITGDDGTLLYRFSSQWIDKLFDENSVHHEKEATSQP